MIKDLISFEDEATDLNTTIASANDQWIDFINKVIEWLKTSGVKLIIGLIALFILFKIVNLIAKGIKKALTKANKDKTITNITYQLVRKGLKILLFIIFLGYVGIDTAGIGTIIASCAVAIGLALQGSLANIAGWFIIVVMRPFLIGDFIEAQGVMGTVEDIHLFHTYLVSPDNKVIIVPNGALANGNIINYSRKNTRRVDLVFSISYNDDVNKAIAAILEVVARHSEILTDPAPFVRLSKCNAYAIDITSRVWVKSSDYWSVYFDLLSEVKEEFAKQNITIPFPRVDVSLKNEK